MIKEIIKYNHSQSASGQITNLATPYSVPSSRAGKIHRFKHYTTDAPI